MGISMALSGPQFSTLSDICKEAATVVLGGLVIGNLLAERPKIIFSIVGLLVYAFLVYFTLTLKKKENG